MSRSAAHRFVSGVATLGFALLLGLAAQPARANDLDASVTCGAQVTAGNQIEVQLEIENDKYSAIDARVLSSIVGNSGDNLAGIGVFGPFVAVASVSVPEATFDEFSFDDVPGVANLSFDALPAVPASLAGTVATLLIVVEVREPGGKSSVGDVTECLVEVQ